MENRADYSLFTKSRGTQQAFLLVYVDDLLITGTDAMIINELREVLLTDFKIKDLDYLRYFLHIEVARSVEGIVVNQHKYALEFIIDDGLGVAKPVATLMAKNLKLTTMKYDKEFQLNTDDA